MKKDEELVGSRDGGGGMWRGKKKGGERAKRMLEAIKVTENSRKRAMVLYRSVIFQLPNCATFSQGVSSQRA